jgi:hypothetical protein
MRIALNKKNKKRNIIISSVIGVLLVSGIASALFIPSSPFALNKRQETRPENTVDYNRPTNEQKQAGDKAKEDFTKNVYENDSSNPSDKRQPSSDSDQQAASISISSANLNNDTLQIRTIISEITSTGSCKLTMEKSGQQSITQEAEPQTLGSYSVCKGFNVPMGGLAKGPWTITVVYTNQVGLSSKASRTVEF